MRFDKEANMRNFYDSVNFAPRKGLYRIWVRSGESQDAPLVARWVDSRFRENALPAHGEFGVHGQTQAEELQTEPDLVLASVMGAF